MFENLDVVAEYLAKILNYGDPPESMYVPLVDIWTFVVSTVEFGMRFETEDPDDVDEDEEDTPPQPEGEVVRLDSFRKP